MIRNTGRQPLHVLKITPGCGGCLRVEMSEKEIGAGEEGVLNVALDMENLPRGPFVKQVVIETDDPRVPKVVLFPHEKVI